MINLYPHKLPSAIYRAFIQDGRKIYQLLPGRLRLDLWRVLFIQIISALVETSTLLVISLFALSLAAPEAAQNNIIVRIALDLSPVLKTWGDGHRQLITFTSILMTVFIFLKVGLFALLNRQTALFSENVCLYINRETLRRYLNKSYFWHISAESQTVIHKFSQRDHLVNFLMFLLLLYSNVICCLALFISLFLAEPKLTLLVMVVFGLCSLGLFLLLRRRLDAAAQKRRDLDLTEYADRLALAQGLREILIYHRQAAMFSKMDTTLAAGRPVRVFLTFSNYLPSLVLELIGFATISILTIGLLVWDLSMPAIVSAISMLMLTAWRVLPAVNRTLTYTLSIRSLRPAAMSYLELLETFIAEEPEPLPEPDPDFRFDQNLTLENINFHYPDGQDAALTNLNLIIARGETIGLIGASGAGKSTLALLLTGLVYPQSGCFLIDGRELSPAGRTAYLRLVGFVPQNPLLLPGTVAENVAFSKWGEPYEYRSVEEACRQAAMDFVFDHPQGLDRLLAGGGQGLSGGQAQRVAIARALFTQPQIIIFDEATSALDQGSENIIAETIKKLPAKTTVVIIAHRLTTVENCDRLVWLEEGRVKAEGPPAEILPHYLKNQAASR